MRELLQKPTAYAVVHEVARSSRSTATALATRGRQGAKNPWRLARCFSSGTERKRQDAKNATAFALLVRRLAYGRAATLEPWRNLAPWRYSDAPTFRVMRHQQPALCAPAP